MAAGSRADKRHEPHKQNQDGGQNELGNQTTQGSHPVMPIPSSLCPPFVMFPLSNVHCCSVLLLCAGWEPGRAAQTFPCVQRGSLPAASSEIERRGTTTMERWITDQVFVCFVLLPVILCLLVCVSLSCPVSLCSAVLCCCVCCALRVQARRLRETSSSMQRAAATGRQTGRQTHSTKRYDNTTNTADQGTSRMQI